MGVLGYRCSLLGLTVSICISIASEVDNRWWLDDFCCTQYNSQKGMAFRIVLGTVVVCFGVS